MEHRWGGSEDGRQVEESLGSNVRDEVEGEQQDVILNSCGGSGRDELVEGNDELGGGAPAGQNRK